MFIDNNSQKEARYLASQIISVASIKQLKLTRFKIAASTLMTFAGEFFTEEMERLSRYNVLYPPDATLQITVFSCFACATQLVDLFLNVGRSFLIGKPVPGSTRNGNVRSKHSPKCAPKCFPLPHLR